MLLVLDPSTCGLPHQDPIGSFETSPGKAIGIDEGLQVINRMIVQRLPVAADSAGDLGQDVAGQVSNFNPGKDQVAAVVIQKMQILTTGLGASPDEAIPRAQIPRR